MKRIIRQIIAKRYKTVWNCISIFLCNIHFLCSNPPSLKTNKVIPKQMKNAHSVITEIGVGDIVAVNCNTIHFTGTDDYIKYHCIIIDNDFCISSGIDCSDIQFENIFKNSAIMNSIIETVEIYKNPDDICYKAKLQCLILKILIEIRTYHTKGISASKYDNKYFKAVKDVILYIQNNYDKRITLEELSKETYINKSGLSKKFKEFTGITIVN